MKKRIAANKGQPKTPGSGRKKGTPNKNSLNFKQRLEELGVDLVQEAVALLKKPLGFRPHPDDPDKVIIEGLPDTEKAKLLVNLVEYAHPKLKSIEQKVETSGDSIQNQKIDDIYEDLKKILVDQPGDKECNGLISASQSQELSSPSASSTGPSKPKLSS